VTAAGITAHWRRAPRQEGGRVTSSLTFSLPASKRARATMPITRCPLLLPRRWRMPPLGGQALPPLPLLPLSLHTAAHCTPHAGLAASFPSILPLTLRRPTTTSYLNLPPRTACALKQAHGSPGLNLQAEGRAPPCHDCEQHAGCILVCLTLLTPASYHRRISTNTAHRCRPPGQRHTPQLRTRCCAAGAFPFSLLRSPRAHCMF